MGYPPSVDLVRLVSSQLGFRLAECSVSTVTAIPEPLSADVSAEGTLERSARALLLRLAGSRLGRRALGTLLEDPGFRARVEHRLSNRAASRATWSSLPAGLDRIEGFEDCAWLFSASPLHHGLSRLEHDEAAHLFRLVSRLGSPEAVEIGRFRGGTTLILAAAGARVRSIDIDAARAETDGPELTRVLDRLGLRDRVEIVVADSRTLPAEPGSVDLVFVDGDHSYEGARGDVDHWWPALRVGGHLVLHDAVFEAWDPRRSIAGGVALVAGELERSPEADRVPAPGSIAHFRKAADGLPARAPG
jgi:predicted O-methyltransferase YrrM